MARGYDQPPICRKHRICAALGVKEIAFEWILLSVVVPVDQHGGPIGDLLRHRAIDHAKRADVDIYARELGAEMHHNASSLAAGAKIKLCSGKIEGNLMQEMVCQLTLGLGRVLTWLNHQMR